MKKRMILIATTVICILLTVGMTACDDEMSGGDMMDEMIGTWVPYDIYKYPVYSFGYRADPSFDYGSSGQLCVNKDYYDYDGEGSSAIEYEINDGILIISPYVSEYSAGGEMGNDIIVQDVQDGRAEINGISYEKYSDEPGDPSWQEELY